MSDIFDSIAPSQGDIFDKISTGVIQPQGGIGGFIAKHYTAPHKGGQETAQAALEVPLTVGTGAAAAVIAPAAQVMTRLSGKSPEYARRVKETTADLLTYQPKGETSKRVIQAISPYINIPSILGNILQDNEEASENFSKGLPWITDDILNSVAYALREAGTPIRDAFKFWGIGGTTQDLAKTALEFYGYGKAFKLKNAAVEGLKEGVKLPEVEVGTAEGQPTSLTPEVPRSERVSPKFTKSVLEPKDNKLQLEQKKDWTLADKDSELIDRQTQMFQKSKKGDIFDKIAKVKPIIPPEVKTSPALEEMTNTAKEKGYTIKYVDKDVLHDYEGMNPEAAKAMGFKRPDGSPMPDNVIYLNKKLDAATQAETVRHELHEIGLMKDGKSYFDAHKEALKHETKATEFDTLPKEPVAIAPETLAEPKVPGIESKMAIRTEKAAIDKGLTSKPFENPLAGYEKDEAFMAKQEANAKQIIANDYNSAVDIAMGKKTPPEGVTAQSIYKYVEEEAIKKGDFDTIYKLGTGSTVPSETSRLGQQIKSADVGTDESPLKAMQEIREARATMVERAGKKIDPAKQAEEISRLKNELEAKQKALDEHLAKKETGQVTRAKKMYGSRNKIVTQDEYLKVKADLRQQFSSQLNVGLDPTIIAKLGKIGAYHLEAGAREFGVWSERVIEDVGEWARPHLKEVWDNAQADKKLQTYIKTRKTRLTNEERKFTERFNNRDFTVKEKTKIPEDEETRFLKAKRDQAKKQYDAAAKIGDITKEEAKKLVDLSKVALDAKEKLDAGGDNFMDNLYDYKQKSIAFDEYTNELKGDTRTPFQKANNYAVKWRRFLLLSSVKTVGKLTNAAMSRFATTTAEDAMAGFWRKVPGVSKVFEKSPRFSTGFNAKATAKSFRQFVEKQTYKDVYNMATKGKASLGTMMGDTYGDRIPTGRLDFFGHLHGALKVLPHRAEFFNALERITEFEEKNGTNMNSPIEQMRVCMEAMEHANRAILMRKNVATNMYTEFLNMLGRHGKGGEATATGIQTQIPIVRVPTNYVAETVNYAVGVPKGIAQTMNVLLRKDALEALTREQADNIARSLAKGSIGAAAFLIGYYNDQNLGGYYQPGEKRKASDVAWSAMKVGDREIPHWLLHIPLMEVAQMGATAHRVVKAKGSALMAAWKSSKGLASQVPFFEQPVRMGEALKNEKTAGKFITEFGASMVIPPDVANVAYLMDEDKQGNTIKRKAKTPEDIIKLKIPGLREEVGRQ